jgi:hypothetical protein
MSTTLRTPKTSTASALLSAPLLAALCCVAAAVAVATPGWVLSGDAEHTLGCAHSLPAGGGTRLLLSNPGPRDLPAGTPIVWHDTGSPQGVAERLVLPKALARGDSVRVTSTKRARGTGCGAQWFEGGRQQGAWVGHGPASPAGDTSSR